MKSSFMGRSPKKVNITRGARSSGKKRNIANNLDNGGFRYDVITGMNIDIQVIALK